MSDLRTEVQESVPTEFNIGYQLGHITAQVDGVIRTLDRMIERLESIENGSYCTNACKRNEEPEDYF